MMCSKDMMLIADDLDINRDVLREMFCSDFEVIDAKNGKECVELVEKYGTRIKILLLDIMMPVMSGLDVLKYRQKDEMFSGIPVIVITVNDEIKNQMDAFRLGATDYITKPFIREIVIYRINNVLSSKRRVDEIVKEKQSLQVKSELDLMTGLYNKMTVEEIIASKLRVNDKINALLVVDIDDFKRVNDIEGHLVGDHTIRIIADLISGHFRKTDTIGRIGGDEFIIYMEDLSASEVAKRKVDELVKLLRYKPNITIPANVSVSIGMAITKPRPYSYEELFEKADKALYCAKENGKGQYVVHGENVQQESVDTKTRTALLFSRNKDVCGILHLMNEDIRLIEILSLEDAKRAGEKYREELCLFYVDISTEQDSGEALLKQLIEIEYFRQIPFLAICQEGNMAQYAQALKANVRDIIPSPVDITYTKRRTATLLGKYGLRR